MLTLRQNQLDVCVWQIARELTAINAVVRISVKLGKLAMI